MALAGGQGQVFQDIPLAEEVEEEDSLSSDSDKDSVSELVKLQDETDKAYTIVDKSLDSKSRLSYDEDKDIDYSRKTELDLDIPAHQEKVGLGLSTYSEVKHPDNASLSLPIYIHNESSPTKASQGITASSSFPSAVKESTLLERMNKMSEKLEDYSNARSQFPSPKHRKNALNERSRLSLRHSFSVDCSSQTSEDDFTRCSMDREKEEREEEESLEQEELIRDHQMRNERKEENVNGEEGEEGLYLLCAG